MISKFRIMLAVINDPFLRDVELNQFVFKVTKFIDIFMAYVIQLKGKLYRQTIQIHVNFSFENPMNFLRV